MKEIILSNPNKESVSFKLQSNSNKITGWTTAFIYSNQGNFLLKGTLDECEEYMESQRHLKWFGNFVIWHKGQSRSSWKHYHSDYTISEPSMQHQYDNSYLTGWKPMGWSKFRFIKSDGWKTIKQFKRMPKKWVDDLDPEFIDPTHQSFSYSEVKRILDNTIHLFELGYNLNVTNKDKEVVYNQIK